MNKNLDKLKQFFRNSKSHNAQERVYLLKAETERDLKKESPMAMRVKMLKDLGDVVMTNRLEEFAVQKLWSLTSDMIEPQKSTEVRHQTLIFYTKLIQGQFKDLSIMRAHFFRLIQANECEADLPNYFYMLKALTENGKDIQNFEDEFGPLVLKWMSQVISAKLTAQYLDLIVNVLKFNAAYIDRDITVGIVQRMCNDVYVHFIDDSETFHQCLFLIETVICYTVFPNEILAPCIVVLCRAVNYEKYLETSHKIMKCLLGTQLGYASLLTMTHILSDSRFHVDGHVLRGAIFHLSINLWGRNQSTAQSGFKYSSTVLMSYLKVLQSEFDIVAYEVAMSLQTLLNKCGKDLGEPSWDILFEILHKIVEREKFLENPDVSTKFNLVVDIIEALAEENHVNADVDKIYSLIEKISSQRSEASILKLIVYKATKISPSQSNWLEGLNDLVDKFYRQHTNQTVRLATIDHLKDIFKTYRACYEDELLEGVIIVKLADVAYVTDIKVKLSVCKFLLEVCSCCDTRKVSEILDILDKVMMHSLETSLLVEGQVRKNENDLEDCNTVVNGLIDLFLEKMYLLPSNHAVKIHDVLIRCLESQYPEVQETRYFPKSITKIRYTIINWMLRIRANSTRHVGYPSPRLISDHVKFSNYLVIDNYQDLTQQNDHQNCEAEKLAENPICILSARKNWDVIIKCLKREKDWTIVQLILKELPKIMQNTPLVMVMEFDSQIEKFANTLIDLFRSNLQRADLMRHFPLVYEKDFRTFSIPAIASLISYSSKLSPTSKKWIVDILKSELRSDGHLNICIQAFTTLLFDKCEFFEKYLAEIILTITKVSDTVAVSLPILEFLSVLAHLPNSFNLSLTQKQFSYVFVSCLPYTSPARYNYYTVSLAHHIIASWFLKARIQWRKDYAKYIIDGIAKNIDKDKAMRDEKHQQAIENESKMIVNEDSSIRKRSSSFGARPTVATTSHNKVNSKEHPSQKTKQRVQDLQGFDMHSFHIELIETCIDFMDRNTFSLSLSLPKRIPAADFLLRGGGQSKTWIVGSHNVITITTSACMDNHENKNCACVCSDWAEITVRKPSAKLSWLVKFENQVGIFANDFSLHDLKSLFSDKEIDPGNPNGALVKKVGTDTSSSLTDELDKLDIEENNVPTSIPLQSTASDSSVFSTQPMNIPEKPDLNREIDDDVSYDGEDSDDLRRNPVRRVNSSPEMRSNWKLNMAKKDSKDGSKSGSSSKDTVSDEQEDIKDIRDIEVPQKKKTSFPKDTKKSCEAIPEEIFIQKEEPMNHRPIPLLSSISAIETTSKSSAAFIPKKQHSADDTAPLPLKRAESNSMNPLPPIPKNTEWTAASLLNNPALSPRYSKNTSITRQVSHNLATENDDSGIRGRSKTISVFRRGDNETTFTMPQGTSSDISVTSSMSSFDQSQVNLATSGISPSFVFVQLFSGGKISNPDIVPVSEKDQSALKVLDLIQPYETHPIGVLYVGPGQANNEVEILRNRFGSMRYTEFLRNLGTLIALKDAKEKNFFMNLEAHKAGNFTYIWHDDIIQMLFHVATLMPTLDSDPNCNEKKGPIGNDNVVIVYNESGEEYNLNTIKTQFNYAAIIVQPLDMGSNLITVKAKGDIEDYFKHLEPMVLSDRGAPLLARQLALHANMASLVAKSLKMTNNRFPHASNWLERLRRIKKLKKKIMDETKQEHQPSMTTSSSTFLLKDVFTKYT